MRINCPMRNRTKYSSVFAAKRQFSDFYSYIKRCLPRALAFPLSQTLEVMKEVRRQTLRGATIGVVEKHNRYFAYFFACFFLAMHTSDELEDATHIDSTGKQKNRNMS